MELTRLSQLTGDMRYYNAVQEISNVLDRQQSDTKLPSMWPQRYDNQRTDFTQGNSFPLGAEADSTYEYLLKMYILMGGTSSADQYENMYKYATDTAIKHSFFRPMNPTNDDVLLSGKVLVQDNGEIQLRSESEHLSCFLGGMFSIRSRVFPNSTHFNIAEKLTAGCIWGYHASPSGILAENIDTIPCPSITDCEWNKTLYDLSVPSSTYPIPFTSAIDTKHHLRPEALESIFIMYRLTGNSYYQDIAWEIYFTIENTTRTEWGNAGLRDVLLREEEAVREDEMESFWLAETLKYLFLIFERTDLIHLDEWVLSTEAHPFRIW